MKKGVKVVGLSGIIGLLVVALAFVLTVRALWRALDIDCDWEAM